MATQMIIKDGQASMVYDDRFRPIMEALGVMNVKRATDVEFDAESGDWIATLLETNEVIARGKNRSECIQHEVEYLERKMSPTH